MTLFTLPNLPWTISKPAHPRYSGGVGKEHEQVYAKLLYNTKYGHALFDPPSTEPCVPNTSSSGDAHLAAFQSDGLQIGDVGYLKDGTFIRLFNILSTNSPQSSNSPSQQRNGSPPDPHNLFSIPDSWNPVHKKDNIPQGETMSSVGTSKKTKDFGIKVPLLPAAGAVASIGGSVEFSTSKAASATLGLPTGADWDEVRNPGLVKGFAIRHGLHWIHHIDALGYGASNGTVLLVTGYVSSKTYATAVASEKDQHQAINFSLSLGPFVEGQVGRQISWTHAGSLQTHMRPSDGRVDPCALFHTHYPFVRGYVLSVAKNIMTLLRTKLYVEDGSKQDYPFSSRNSEKKRNQADDPKSDSDASSGSAGDHAGSGTQRGLAELKNISAQAYHPLLLVNDILFDLEPRALMAMSHDDNMTALLEDGEGIPDRATLKQRMLDGCKWRFDEETGVVSLDLPNEEILSTREPLLERQSGQLREGLNAHEVKHSKKDGLPDSVEIPKFVLKLSTPVEKENIDPNKTKVAGKKTLEKQLSPPSLSLNTPLMTPRHACSPPTPRSLSVY